MDFSDAYFLDDLISRERWRQPLLLLAMAGVALLFFRSGLARIVGCLLILARFLAMPVSGMEWSLLISMALLGGVAMMLRQRDPEAVTAAAIAELPEPDDASEPAPCPACHGLIPAGRSRCPQCGWSYAVSEGAIRDEW